MGETWLVENVMVGQFESCVKIDFEKRRDLHVHFNGALEPKTILGYLELSAGRITPGTTLLFFDEIQACPRAIMALRYFYEEMPELHVVAAGSLLEFAFGEISIPVCRVQYLYLYPMTFYEYLLAMGKEPMAEASLLHPGKVDESIQKMILSELRNYFFIGGMPECINTYHNSGSLLDTFRIQSELLDSYRDDFSKYMPRIDPLCLDAVFLNVSKNIGDQIKYTRLNGGHSSQTNQKAFDLLAMYRGKLAEQFVAQELLAWHDSDLFYWARDARSSNAEIDYLTVFKGNIYPIEVKSGTGGSLRSLHLMLENYPNCPNGLVLYSGTYRNLPEQKLTFLPLHSVSAICDKRLSITNAK